jgi:uncharacterized membrane protein YpjA
MAFVLLLVYHLWTLCLNLISSFKEDKSKVDDSVIKASLPVSAIFVYLSGLFYVMGEVKNCEEA